MFGEGAKHPNWPVRWLDELAQIAPLKSTNSTDETRGALHVRPSLRWRESNDDDDGDSNGKRNPYEMCVRDFGRYHLLGRDKSF